MQIRAALLRAFAVSGAGLQISAWCGFFRHAAALADLRVVIAAS